MLENFRRAPLAFGVIRELLIGEAFEGFPDVISEPLEVEIHIAPVTFI